MWEVRWSRSRQQFAFKRGEADHFASEAYGQMEALGEDNETLRLHMGGYVQMDVDTAHLFMERTDLPPADGEFLGYCKWRICARRGQGDWRLLDEDNQEQIYYVPGFRGVYNIQWSDHQSHLHHVGEAYLLPDGYVLLRG